MLCGVINQLTKIIMDSVIRIGIPFALVVAMAVVFFMAQKRLLPEVKPRFAYLMLVVGAISFIPSLYSRDIMAVLGIERILSLKKLIYFSLTNAAIAEIPKLLIIWLLLYRFCRSTRIGTYMLISFPLILGFTLASMVYQLFNTPAEGHSMFSGYAEVALNGCISIIMGFFVGIQKITNGKAGYPLVGIFIVIALHVFLEFVLYLKEVDLAIIFGLDLLLIGFLLIYLSDAKRNESLLWQNSCCE